MKAMILAAGRGTRLQPHTLEKPKALVEVGGRPLLAHALQKLIASGFRDIVVNVHHFAPMIIEYLQTHPVDACVHISDESDRLLDTGGGVLKAKPFLMGSEPFLVHNVDILSDIDLCQLWNAHRESHALATLAVGQRESSRYFLFDPGMRLAGWRNNITHKEIVSLKDAPELKAFAFAGIHVISPEFFSLAHKIGPFPIVEAYLSLCASQPIMGLDTSDRFVLDVGNPNNLQQAQEYAGRVAQANA